MIALVAFNLNLYRKTKNLQSGVDNTAVAIIAVSVVCMLPRIAVYAIFLTKNVFQWELCQCDFEYISPAREEAATFVILHVNSISGSINSAANFLVLYFYGSKFKFIFQKEMKICRDILRNLVF